MRKIRLVILAILLAITATITPVTAKEDQSGGDGAVDQETVDRRLYTEFEDVSQYIEFSRVWLSLCPKLVNLPPDQRDQYARSLSKDQRELAPKICTTNNQINVKIFLKYLLAINIYGSVDIKHKDYNLPGAEIKAGGSHHDSTRTTKIIFFNNGVNQYVSSANSNETAQEIFRTIVKNEYIDKAVEKIINSCQSTTKDGFRDCNNLLNIDAFIDNHNIFSRQSREQTYLQQMHFNALSNANIVSEIKTDLDRFKFQGITDEFRQQQLIPTLNFATNNDLNLPEIAPAKSDAYPDPAPRGTFGRFLINALKLGTHIADITYKIIAKWFLNIKPDLFTANDSVNVWSAFRNITNIGFVLTFLLIVASQLTGRGLSNYQAKVMLPKLLVAIVLVNLSYLATQIIIDLSNIISKNIYQLLINPDSINGNFRTIYEIYANKRGSIADILGIVLMIFASGFVLLSTFLNILLLTIRDAVVVVLVVISPLAMLSAVLPRLDSLFKQWWRMLVNMIAISPLISALIGGAILVDFVVSDSGADAGLIAFLSAKLAMSGTLIACPFFVFKTMRKVDALVTFTDNRVANRVPFLIRDEDPLDYSRRTYKWLNNLPFRRVSKAQRQFDRNQRRASRQGRFWALSASQARQSLNKNINLTSADFSRQESADMIDSFYDYYKNDLKTDNLKTYQHKLANYGTNKDAMLALALSYAKDSSNQGQTNVNFILKALYNAKSTGASQAELNHTFEAVLTEFKQRSDFRSIGLLKANFEHNNNQHGEFDSQQLAQADQATTNTEHQEFQESIYKHTKQSLNELQIGNKDTNQIVSLLDGTIIKRGSVANQAFIDHITEDKSARDSLFNAYHQLSVEAQNQLGADTELLNKLRDMTTISSSTLTGNLDDIDIPDISSGFSTNDPELRTKILHSVLNQRNAEIEALKQQILDSIKQNNQNSQ